MSWEVVLYSQPSGRQPVADWLEGQSAKVQAAFIHYVDLLTENGTTLGEPHVKPLRDKLYELRISVSGNSYRTLYFAASGRRFVLVHAFHKKTKTTPRKDLELALKRMHDFHR